MGPLSRLVGSRPPFESSLSKVVLPLIIDANGPNGAIALTKTFNHICFRLFVTVVILGYKKHKMGIRENKNRVYCSLKLEVPSVKKSTETNILPLD